MTIKQLWSGWRKTWRPLTKPSPIAVFVVCACTHYAWAGVNVPDWVVQATKAPIAGVLPEDKAVVLLSQTDFTVLDSGDYIEHSREVVKVLRPDWRKNRDLTVMLQGGEKVNSIHAWAIDSAGRQFELKDKDFREVAPFSFELYDDIHGRSAPAPAPSPGSVIGFEYETRRHPKFREISLSLQDENPVVREDISLSLPATWEYRDSWTETAAVQPSQTGPNQWKWTVANLRGFEEEQRMPAIEARVPKLDIAIFRPGQTGAIGSWKEIGKWYSEITADRRNPTPEIIGKTQEVVQGKRDFDGKLRAITEFVQSNIRYVAIEIGIGGFQPHAAADVFREKYGDCKDKVTLLSTMLHQAGIESTYVLIDTHRGLVNPKLPLVWFDHAIIAIELPPNANLDTYSSVVTATSGKRYIIFDPTDEYTPVGSLRGELQNMYALLMTDAGGEMIHTPMSPPRANTVDRRGTFVLTSAGGLAGQVAEERNGDFALWERYRLRYTDQRQRNSDFEHWLGRSLQGFTVEAINIQNAEERQKSLTLEYKLSVPHYGQTRGSMMLLRPRVLEQKSSIVERKARQYTLDLEQTSQQTDTYEIELPSDYQVDDVPDPVKIDVGFASYQSKIEVNGSKLRYWREYVVRDLTLPPDKYSQWANLQAAISADENSAVVLRKVH